MATPDRAPNTIRAPNCIGTVRLGVDGSWSVTYSTIASTLNTPTDQTEPMKASGVPASGSQPRYAAQLTAAGAVKARKPATTPISSASSNTIMAVPPPADRASCPPAHSRSLLLFEKVADGGDRGCRLL